MSTSLLRSASIQPSTGRPTTEISEILDKIKIETAAKMISQVGLLPAGDRQEGAA